MKKTLYQLFVSVLLVFFGGYRIQAQTVPSPQQTDQIITDPNSNGKADPGDSIRYKVTIQNTGAGNATGVKLNAIPDPRTTLNPASFRTSPLAMPDGPYSCIGNVGITVPDGANDLLANDYDDNPGGLTITAGTFATTQGGSITIAANGSFSYNPPRGYEGTDTYQYTLNDGNAVAGVTTTDLGTVTFTVSGMIWFINNTGGACASNCDGRLSNPYTSLTAFNTANAMAGGLNPDNNDNIFIYESSTAYTGGIVLRNGQKLFGQDATATLAVMTGLTPPTFSNALPATNSANGTFATITHTAGDGVTLGVSNTLRGFRVGNTPAANAGIIGNGIGTLTLTEVSVNGTGQILSLNNGTANASFNELSTTSTTQTAIVLSNLSGSVSDNNASNSSISGAGGAFSITGPVSTSTVSLTFNGDVTHAGANPLVQVQNHATGTVTFQNGTLSSTAGSVNFTNADGTYNFNGTTTLSGGPRIAIDGGSSGSFNFNSSTSVTNPANIAFDLNGSNATVDYNGTLSSNTAFRLIDIASNTGGSASFDGTLTFTGNAIGIRCQQNTGGTYSFNAASKTITSGVNNAVSLVTNTGATINFTGGGLVINTTSGIGFNATGGGTVSVGTGANNNTVATTAAKAVNLDGVLANISFATVSAGNAPTEGINLNNLSASSSLLVPGAVTLGMAAGSNANVNISGCTNCTIDLGTNGTTHNAVNLNSRRNSGVILNSVSGTIRFGNVTAPNPNSVTVPAIKSTTCAGSIFFAKTDVNMNNAGSNEGFTNIETPQDNSGDGDAIYVNNFTGTAFTINGGTIENAGDDGIDIRNSRNLSLSNVTTEDVGKSAGATCVDCNSSGVQGYNLTGTNTITNCSFQRGRLRNFYLSNSTGTGALNITGSTFNDTRSSGSPATDNLQIYATSTASLAVDIENSTFTRSATKQIDVVVRNSAQLTKCDITGCTMDYVDGPSAGIFVEGLENSQVNFNIMNNPKLHSQDENVVTISAAGTANVQGRIKGNTNMKFLGSSSGGSIFSGIRVLSDGTTSVATVLIEGNTLEIVNCDFAVNLSVQGANSARINATVNSNVITATGTTHLEGIIAIVNNTVAVAKLICLTINNNNVSGANLARVGRLRALSATGIQVTNYVTDFNTTWVNNGNVGSPVAEGVLGAGTITAAPMPCAVPTNPLP